MRPGSSAGRTPRFERGVTIPPVRVADRAVGDGSPVCSARITRKSRYAVRALVELARRTDREPVCAARIARRRAIPERFLEQIFGELRGAGLLQSRRGAGGGYAPAVPPEEITVLDVVEALGGAARPPRAERCGVPRDEADRVFEEAARALEGVLEEHSIADLAKVASAGEG